MKEPGGRDPRDSSMEQYTGREREKKRGFKLNLVYILCYTLSFPYKVGKSNNPSNRKGKKRKKIITAMQENKTAALHAWSPLHL